METTISTSEQATLLRELNQAYEREGRYLAVWLELFPEDHLGSPLEPSLLVQRYHSLLPLVGEAARLRHELAGQQALQHDLRQALAGRQALLEKVEVQAVLWVGGWPILQWPPLKRLVNGFLNAMRTWLRPA